ncbi:hypothetical protein D477_014196 [Arthrobacter crystallopoietes BAB-32]|uniref:Uncharacterized protein n=1 Tax=Arthrobacter crystallopoietes BAB-32 TaxID=1246476 RepID=N1V0I9_9MICC|nr:hypothetical protein [Arthrobacter crystallopoietes]EMY33559.1 hypothetical protein D477_014196 [Arthrobacter crystallopoietes BAB-32]
MSDCGMCLTASDIGIGVAGDPIAYPHPGCPDHGSCEKFVPGGSADGAGRPLCLECRAYEDEHLWKGGGQ